MCEDNNERPPRPRETNPVYHNPSRNALGLPANQSQNRQTNRGFRKTAMRGGRPFDSSSSHPVPNRQSKYPNMNQTQNSQRGVRPRLGNTGFRQNTKPRYEKPELDRSKIKFGYKMLEELSVEKDPLKVAVEFANNHNGLEYLLGEDVFLKERPEWIILLTKVLTKVCQCQFPENKIKVLNLVFDSEIFIKLVLDCLHSLTSGSSKEKAESFLVNIHILLESLVDHFPTSSIEKLHNPVQQIFAEISCIEQFEGFQIDDAIKKNFRNLESRLRDIRSTNEKMTNRGKTHLDNGEPPEDFRTFELYPYEEEIRCNKHAFIRRNIVDGGYKNVEHYLDVQFRLLREDLMIPLREGFAELIDKLSRDERRRLKINYLRYFEHCALHNISTNRGTISYNVCFDVDRKLNHINWEYNQWFKYGSLVFLSFDNFSSFLVAKVSDKDNKICREHRIISVELVGSKEIDIEDWDKKMTMVESTIFFQPYYHVMKALKQFNEDNFPLQKYIVEVNPDIRYPAYLQEDSILKIGDYLFDVLDDHAWPSAEELSLDEFQYEALKSALTKEFAIMQGPPGTGKTYLGLKIVEALVKYKVRTNSKETNREDTEFPELGELLIETRLNDKCAGELNAPILVVCYTNHALDQFLEGILKFTKSVVRVGSMTKSEAIKGCELSQHRHLGFDRSLDSAFLTLNNQMKDIMKQIQTLEQNLCNIDSEEGILKYDYLSPFISPSHNVQLGTNDKLSQWLMINNFTLIERELTSINATQGQEKEMLEEHSIDESDSDDEDEARREFKYDECVFDMKLDETVKENIHIITLQYLHVLRHEIEVRCNQLEYDYGENIQSDEYAWKRWHLESEYQEVRYYIETISQQFEKRNFPSKVKDVTGLTNNLADLNIDQRWKLYFQWVRNLKSTLLNSMKTLEKKFRDQSEQLQEAKQLQDLNVLRHFNIVGITTTAAARNHLLLTSLKPNIVIVEEAAEVLEAHIVTALTNHCQHLILIGDHQQLRPNPTVYKLAKLYNLEISLFERMINNKLSFSRLGVQHRMRPEICELITPAIYHNLQNHPSVYKFDDVKGMTKNLFFVSHEVDEVKDDTMQSFRNPHEGDFILELAKYLLLQGYAADEITILTTYSGQLIYLKMEKKNIPSLSEVRVTTVDNYQGEECQIILLSLVRSNPEEKIGFLATSNRVCVALSRAREGFYLIGNMKALDSGSDIWKLIKSKFEEQKSIGSHLELICAIHQNKTLVSEKNDFLSVAEGGCSIICDTQLLCGHKCTKLCHSHDLQHEQYICRDTCIKVCSEGHPCTYLCYQCSEVCQPCKVPMKNFTLPCSHVKDIQCFQTKTYPCEVMIEVDIERCGHTALVSCHSVTSGTIKCPKPCDTRLPCGHQCTMTCHVDEDPDHIEFKCEKKCEKPKNGCSLEEHCCPKLCWEPCPVCNEMVVKKLPCGHEQKGLCHLEAMECLQPCSKTMDCGHPCKKRCKDSCGGCDVLVDKEIKDCGHKVNMKCRTQPDIRLCHNPCQKTLSCGHKCGKKCNEDCTSSDQCSVLVEHASVTSLCSHGNVRIPCKDSNEPSENLQDLALKYCIESCEEILLCGHTCKGTCGECQQKRFHKVCNEKCERTHKCGHRCKQDCSSICLPCDIRCSIKCRHRTCKRFCYEPCVPCYDDCPWECEHEKCPSNCSDVCRRRRCYKACQKVLECGHQCIGFCGEPCPDKCRVCNEDEVQTEYFGSEKKENARFVVLEDCGHFFESDEIEIYLGVRSNSKNMDTEIAIKTCPKCKEPILSTMRFMNTIRFIRNSLAAVKHYQQKLLPPKDIPQQKIGLVLRVNAIENSSLSRIGSRYWSKILQNILSQIEDFTIKDRKGKRTRKTKFVTIDQMRLLSFIVDCMESLQTAYEHAIKKYWSDSSKILVLNQLDNTLLNTMNIPQNNISEQLKFDFFCELDRFYALINILSLKSNYRDFKYFKNEADLTLKYTKCTEEIGRLDKFDMKISDHFYALLEEIQSEINKNIPFGMKFDQVQLTKPDATLWQDVQETNIRVYKCFRSHLYHVTQTEIGNVEEDTACPDCARRGQPQPNQLYQRDPNWKYQVNQEYAQDQGYRRNERYGSNQPEGRGPNQGYRPNEGRGANQGYRPNEGRGPNQGNRPNEGRGPNQGNRPNEGRGPNQGYRPNEGRGANQGYPPIEGRGRGNRSNRRGGHKRR